MAAGLLRGRFGCHSNISTKAFSVSEPCQFLVLKTQLIFRVLCWFCSSKACTTVTTTYIHTHTHTHTSPQVKCLKEGTAATQSPLNKTTKTFPFLLTHTPFLKTPKCCSDGHSLPVRLRLLFRWPQFAS